MGTHQKKISISAPGSTGSEEVTIHPGTTAKEVLDLLAEDGELRTADGDRLKDGDNLYKKVGQGDQVHLIPATDAGNTMGGLALLSIISIVILALLAAHRSSKPPSRSGTRSRESLWKENWMKFSSGYRGTYQTKHGSWKGLIKKNYPGYRCYIYNPPEKLIKKHPDCIIFKKKTPLGPQFYIHIEDEEKLKDLDTAILTAQKIIQEATR